MYIADGFNNRVLKWQIGAPMGVVVAGIPGPKTTLDTIASSYAIYVDAESNLYVSECGNKALFAYHVVMHDQNSKCRSQKLFITTVGDFQNFQSKSRDLGFR